MFGEGISKTGELLKIAVEDKIITKSGAWFAYNDEKIGQGSEKAKNYLKENPEVFDEVEKQVRELHGLTEQPSSETTKEDTSPKSKGAKKTQKEETEEIKLNLDEIEIEE